jgi:quercetin dioxygenase-like cupin family protein
MSISTEAIQDEIGRIVASRAFRSRLQLRNLLRYLAKAAIEGRQVDQRAIAVEVLSRNPSSFDSKKDSCVRAATTKLRRALKAYYEETGRGDPILLGIEERTYAATFRELSGPTPPSPEFGERPFGAARAEALVRLISAICDLEGITPAERTHRFREQVRKREGDSNIEELWRTRPSTDFDLFLEGLKDFSVSIRDIRKLAALFGIHPLLLDPLLSEIEQTDCLTLDFDKDFIDVGKRGEQFRGNRCRYLIPRTRIAGTDASFVKVILDPAGRPDLPAGVSDQHEHPGDELAILISSGRVEIRLAASGARLALGEGDFAHFYAELRHSAVNVGAEPARMLVVRFYHLDTVDTRQTVLRSIENVLDEMSKTGRARLMPPYASAWIRQVLPRYRSKGLDGIADRLGLGRLLERWQPRRNSEPVPDQIRRILEGRPVAHGRRGRRESLGIDEIVLRSFMCPAVPGAVVIHQPEDLEEIPAHLVPPGASVLLPRRNLSCSDISVLKVRLEKGVSTPAHSHPGFEAVFVLSGGPVEVYFEPEADPVCSLSAWENHLCHFNSRRHHSVRNAGGAPAEFLVIRFYRDGPRR